jgi:Ni/Co efflux regulator RcnB
MLKLVGLLQARLSDLIQGETMRTTNIVLAVLLSGAFAASPALAEKPEWAGNGKSGKHAGESSPRNDGGRDERGDGKAKTYFNDQQRVVMRQYYEESFRSGRCPPGLAKKKNGCLPPGQARKWSKGKPLPRDVIYYDLPPQVVVSLGAPPAGHKYVRIATDILLIAVGTGMVVDALGDLAAM